MSHLSLESAYASTVALTFDVDWAPDFVIDDLVQALRDYAIPATVFCTHESPGVRRLLSLESVETAIHPNFLVADGRSETQILDDVLRLFPRAQGVRNHVLYYHSRLLTLFHERNLRYFSNDLMFLHAKLVPYYDWSGMIRLPIYWEDDVHAMCFERNEDTVERIVEIPGMKIFNFHPIHFYLNTSNLIDYHAAKSFLHDEKRLLETRRGGKGTRSFLETLVRVVPPERVRSLCDIATEFRSQVAYDGAFAKYIDQMKTSSTEKSR